MTTKTSPTLTATIVRTLTVNLIGCACLGLAVLFSLIETPKVSVDRPDVEATPAAAIADLEADGAWCWTGGSDLVPNVVVFTKADGALVVSRSAKAIDRAIGQAVFGEDHGMTVYAFCEAGR